MEGDSVVEGRDGVLALVGDLAFGSFVGEGGFVDRFEQAGAEGAVDPVCGSTIWPVRALGGTSDSLIVYGLFSQSSQRRHREHGEFV